jgi:hypothetical protein
MEFEVLASVSTGVLAGGWFAAVLFIGFMLVRWRSMSPFKLSVPGIAFTTYIGLLLVPALLLAPQEPDAEAAKRFVIFTVLAGVAMLMGMAFVSLVYPSSKINLRDYIHQPVLEPNRSGWGMVLPLLLIVILGAAVLRFYHRGSIPFLHMLFNLHSYTTIVEAREATKSLSEQTSLLIRLQFYVIAWSELLLMPTIVIAAQAMHQTTRLVRWRNLFWISLCGAMFLALWDADRSSGARMAATLIGATLLIRSRISWKLIAAGVGALILPLAIAVAMHPENMDRTKIYTAMGDRAFVTPAQVTYYYFEAFPKFYAHTWGRGTSVLGWMLGREPAHLPRMVAQYVLGSQAASTYVNCGFIGTGWAEFGIMGVIIFGMAAGGLAQAIQNCIMRQAVYGKRVNWVVFHAFQIPLWTVVLASGGVTEFFLGRGLLFAFLLAWWLERRWYDPTQLQWSGEPAGQAAGSASPASQGARQPAWRGPPSVRHGPTGY